MRLVEKLKLKQAVLVEGKYDAIQLENILDAPIFRTDGFRLYKRAESRAMLRRIAETRGLIVLTDSDAAGFQIRQYIKSFIPNEYLFDAYIPEMPGKEPRKTGFSKAGLLGVEGMSGELLRSVLKKAVDGQENHQSDSETNSVTKYTLYCDGFAGTPGSKQRLQLLLKRLSLPVRMQPNALVNYLYAANAADEYHHVAAVLQAEVYP